MQHDSGRSPNKPQSTAALIPQTLDPKTPHLCKRDEERDFQFCMDFAIHSVGHHGLRGGRKPEGFLGFAERFEDFGLVRRACDSTIL